MSNGFDPRPGQPPTCPPSAPTALTQDQLFDLHAMPYFVYKIAPPRQLTHLATLTRYQDAREQVRTLRAADPAAGAQAYRLIFAAQQAEAERLLSRPRDERVIGED